MTAPNLNEFWVTKPVDQIQYTTLEFYNAQAGTRRFVAGQQSSKGFQLEDDAPRNAGQLVNFEPVPFEAPEPEQGEEGEVYLELQMGAIGFEAKQYLMSVFGAWPPTVDVVWRRHLEGVTAPAYVLHFQIDTSVIQNVNAAITAGQVNQGARSVSRLYKSDEFFGLRLSI